ncbi:MAG: hypothetical protein JSW01_02375 [Candidatus Bathyarchaeota archaeon]|nr:MAG: hypothetical protein JSW01_02375 [Candidatus Bathyarchaeota archaeon]
MAGKDKRLAGLVEVAPVLFVVLVFEAVSVWYFYPEVGGVIAGLLLLVALGSLLVITTSWTYFSMNPLRFKVRSRRRLSRRERRRGRRTPLSVSILEWLDSQGSKRVASIVVLLLFLTSLSAVFLVASELALSFYKEIFTLAPESVQTYLRSIYSVVRPMMGLKAVEKCLLVQNLPAIFVAAGSLAFSRLRR